MPNFIQQNIREYIDKYIICNVYASITPLSLGFNAFKAYLDSKPKSININLVQDPQQLEKLKSEVAKSVTEEVTKSVTEALELMHEKQINKLINIETLAEKQTFLMTILVILIGILVIMVALFLVSKLVKHIYDYVKSKSNHKDDSDHKDNPDIQPNNTKNGNGPFKW